MFKVNDVVRVINGEYKGQIGIILPNTGMDGKYCILSGSWNIYVLEEYLELLNNDIKDSGDRTKYPSGAVRDRRVGKGMPCLIPTAPMERVAIHYELGRNKYSTANGDNLTEENWKAGFPLMDMWDSARRHLDKWKVGMVDEDHLAACIWNVLGLMETERRIQRGILPKSLDNRDINEFENPRDLYKENDEKL